MPQLGIKAALVQEAGNGRLERESASVKRYLDELGVSVGLFHPKRLVRGQVPLSRDTLVVGHIPVVLSALEQLGIEPPSPIDYPICLRPWLRRRTWTSSVGEVVQLLQEEVTKPFFVKPLARSKRFRGVVVESWSDLYVLGGASNDTQVHCSNVVTWKSEFRTYVAEQKVVGICHYAGDAGLNIDETIVESAVRQFAESGEAPRGYAADFGILSTGETALVEVNDGFGLGTYGLSDAAYASVLIARWRELVS